MAIKTYEKETPLQLSKNFKSTEFDCHGDNCCKITWIDEKLIQYLQDIRDHFGKSVNVNSAYYCSEYNKNINNIDATEHTKGQAADIHIKGVDPKVIAQYAEKIGVLGIGLYNTDDDGHFVHIDTRASKSFWIGQKRVPCQTFQEDTTDFPIFGKMKYSDKNRPTVCMMTQSTCYNNTIVMKPKGVLWHSTGANNPYLKRYVQPSDNTPDREEMLSLIGINEYGNDWNHIKHTAGLNCWIGKLADGTVSTLQTMPWNYQPKGCSSGKKGSCNNGWIQFECCEDSLTDEKYFNEIYQEGCEITAYLCKMYDIDPKGTVMYNDVEVPTILCHYDSYWLGLGNNHGDVDYWFENHNKTMDDVRNDVAILMGIGEPPKKLEEETKEIYRVRKDWEDVGSNIGSYYNLEYAVAACDEAGPEYEVYNSSGVAIYPERELEEEIIKTFKIGDEVKLLPGATYSNGKTIPSWVFNYKLYVRGKDKNGDIIFSTKKTGTIIGITKIENLVDYNTKIDAKNFQSYIIAVTADLLNVRSGPGTGYSINGQIKKHSLYTIIEEKNNWGKLKNGDGWIHLKYTNKIS